MAKIKKKGFVSSLSLMRFFCDLIRPIAIGEYPFFNLLDLKAGRIVSKSTTIASFNKSLFLPLPSSIDRTLNCLVLTSDTLQIELDLN